MTKNNSEVRSKNSEVRNRSVRHSPSGLTLIEVLIATTIAAGVLTMVTFFSIDITKFGLFLGDRLEVERDLEQTLRTFISEARSIQASESGSYAIAQANTTSFTFYTDVDADGTIEQVRYFLNGTVLQKGITEPTGIPATYPPVNETVRDVVPYIVAGPDIFTYWDQGWTGEIASLSSPIDTTSIRLVRMRATVDKDTAQLPAGSTQSIHAMIRNLRDEL